MQKSSLQYRKDRIDKLSKTWNMQKLNDLFLFWKIPEEILQNLRYSVGIYIAKSLHFDYTNNENKLLELINKNRHNRINVTPNGGVVPKKESALEYNIFLKTWCDTVRELIKNETGLLKKFRLTPNIRIKFEKELEENVGRDLDTALPHSDAWVEGPWGMNCHIPLFGDTNNNYLHFYKLKDENLFSDDFLNTSATYREMQWVMNYYTDDNLLPPKNSINISDYALIHKTNKLPNAGTRVSIDTTIFAGDHDVHPDRELEYMNTIPYIGDSLFVKVTNSELDEYNNKKSIFSHYTSGSLQRIFF
jgi:hypothetical protein